MREFAIHAAESTGQPIGNRFSNLSIWHYLGTVPDEQMWHEWAEAMPEGWLKQHYPWIEETQVFVASGGSYLGYPRQQQDEAPCEFDRDLFQNPSDRTRLDDYEFAPLIRACRNMLDQGIRPCLKLHAVPVKYTTNPKIGWFRVNCRPPDDYEVYAAYISALAQALVDAFGPREVARWRWFVGTEMENPMWWQAADESADSTMAEYLRFHDWSVFGLERVLGKDCGPIGAHAMMAGDYTGGLWDPEVFMQHCAVGTNHATGARGSRLDFFGISYYDRAPGYIESDEWQTNLTGDGGDLALLEAFVQRTRSALDARGFTGMPIEVSEGGMLFGMDGKWLWNGLAPGGAFDASWTAWAFWKLLENDVAIWSRWSMLRTGGLFHGPEAAATHAMNLIGRMRGDERLAVEGNADGTPLLRVISGKAPEGDTVRVLVFHHAADKNRPNSEDPIRIYLQDLPFSGHATLTSWVVDSAHGDFWPQWETDRAAQGITDADYFRSRDQIDVAHALSSDEARAFWRSKEAGYEKLATLPAPSTESMQVSDGALTIETSMPCWCVRLFEISPA